MWGEFGEGSQRAQASTYKINKSRGYTSNVQHDD